MPTSITVAPGFTKSGVTKAARPTAATSTSASRARAGTSGVREWQMVTVASWCSSSSAIGLPTMSLRPITTARRPATTMPSRFSSSITPSGVQATSTARFCASRPTFCGWKPSTSLAGETASNTRCSAPRPMPAGSGDCTRMPSTVSSPFSRSTSASTSASGALASTRNRSAWQPASAAVRSLFRT